MESEHLENVLILLGVEKAFIKPDDLIEALRTRVIEDMEKGEHRLIGRILMEWGHICAEQIEEILNILGKGLPLLKEV
jgi:hypothetical protein